MPNPDALLANGIYRLSRRFYAYMVYMAAVTIEAVLVILYLQPRAHFLLAPLGPGVAHFISNILLPYLLPLTVIPSAPFVLYSIWKTWKSLSKWRKSFLRYALVSSIESSVFEDQDPQERLVKAMVSANPDYEDILKPQLEKSGTGYRELSALFKNATLSHDGKTVTFDVIIGAPGLAKRQLPSDKEQDGMVDSLLHSITRIGNMANILRAISEVGISAGRIVDGPGSTEDYDKFAADLKILAAHTRSKVIRAYLVTTEIPKAGLVAHAKNKNNWPRYDLHRIPIDLIVQEPVGYEVLLTN
jgi:hypothetical protein